MNVVKENVLGWTVVFAASAVFGQATIDVSLSGEGNVTNLAVTSRPASSVAPGWGGNGTVFNFHLDSPDDILVIDATLDITSGMLHDPPTGCPPGADCSPPVPALEEVFLDLKLVPFVETPGGTSAADTTPLDSGMQVSYFDTTREPDQVDFQFARFTLIPDDTGIASATFSGRIQTAGDSVQYNYFTVAMNSVVPEPNGMGTILIALFGSLGVLRPRRNARLF